MKQKIYPTPRNEASTPHPWCKRAKRKEKAITRQARYEPGRERVEQKEKPKSERRKQDKTLRAVIQKSTVLNVNV